MTSPSSTACEEPAVPSRRDTAVVTGGSDGLGYAIAEALAARGADLILVGRDPHKLDRARDTLLKHGTAVHAVPADLAGPGAAAAVGEAVRAGPTASTRSSTTWVPRTSRILRTPRRT
ncbi:SDR family NAD(P)-dependent oxidoreductase [Streptomyces ardesiacus]|uniref:SDR family NAD(P)-dependent oxidoreductase n=1 Tax=Streptomyces ardesiacus TaxID=285564 RepID=UPI00364C5CF5